MGDESAVSSTISKAEQLAARRLAHQQASDRILAELDAEDEEERKDSEKRRKRAASLGAPQAENATAITKYWEMAGTLGAFSRAVDLHPHERMAATGGALGSISVWSQLGPVRAHSACGFIHIRNFQTAHTRNMPPH